MVKPENYPINYTSVLLSVLFFLTSYSSSAQSIIGSISGGFMPLNGAIVRNIQAGKIAVSDDKGNFQIKAVKGDTLTISFIGYKTDSLVVNTQTFAAINLQPLTNLLSEVLIRSNKLSPLLQLRKNQEDYKQIYRIGNNRNIFSASGDYRHIGVGLSIDALYSNFSKEGKDARKLQRVFLSNYQDELVDNRFTKSLVSKITGYQGKQLEDFMVNNRPNYDFIESASDYDLIQYIQRRIQGVVLQTDHPSAKKTDDHRFTIKYKMPVMKSATDPGIR